MGSKDTEANPTASTGCDKRCAFDGGSVGRLTLHRPWLAQSTRDVIGNRPDAESRHCPVGSDLLVRGWLPLSPPSLPIRGATVLCTGSKRTAVGVTCIGHRQASTK